MTHYSSNNNFGVENNLNLILIFQIQVKLKWIIEVIRSMTEL